MARPLPKDAAHIADNARKSEVKSIASFAFIGGLAIGFAVGAAVFAGDSGEFYFGLGALAVVVIWYFTTGRAAIRHFAFWRKKKKASHSAASKDTTTNSK